jgi:hypothetical protein
MPTITPRPIAKTTVSEPPIAHIPNQTRVLAVNGIEVQEHFLQEFLELLDRYGTLRTHSVAFGLFPGRPKSAATAAAQRVIANAKKIGFIDFKDDPKTRFRYYALTRAGARHLRDEGYWADATTPLLKKLVRAVHREWTSLCAMAAVRQGAEGFAENDYAGQDFRSELTTKFECVPDALTFATLDNNTDVAVWHEFELSRRSGRGPNAAPLGTHSNGAERKDMSGIGRFRQLIHTLRTTRAITHNGKAYPIHLAFHCATPNAKNTTLQSILMTHLAAYAKDHNLKVGGNDVLGYTLPFEGKGMGVLVIRFYSLPHTGIEAVWHDSNHLPLPNSGLELMSDYNEQFMKPAA